MGAQGQEELRFSRGLELAIAIYGREGSNVEKVVQRIAVVSESSVYCVFSHAHVNVSVGRKKEDHEGQSWCPRSPARGMKELFGRPVNGGYYAA